MTEALPFLTLALAAVSAVLLVLLLLRKPPAAEPDALTREAARSADDAGRAAKLMLEALTRQLREADELARDLAEKRAAALRAEVTDAITKLGDTLREGTKAQGDAQAAQVKALTESFATLGQALDARLESLRTTLFGSLKETSDLVATKLTLFERAQVEASGKVRADLADSLTKLATSQEQRAEALRAALNDNLEKLRGDNEKKLEQMRATVEEKLQATLTERLGESFQRVSEQLDRVHRGLGEMQQLQTGVGDLRRMLTNVKSRGTWAEVQLSQLLEQMLTAEQYEANREIVKGSGQRVEFAIRLPGHDDGAPVWLPIDCKFPIEDYERLMQAQDSADAEAVQAAARALETRVKQEAKRIREKYVAPPASTDFALLYLPTEGLFAEIARRPGLLAELQASQRVTVVGPTTLAALLNSLQMGFRTLAIQKRSSEVWRVLGEAKAEFVKYAAIWEKVSDQLATAQKTVDSARAKTTTIERKLRDVVALDTPAAPALSLVARADDPS